MARRIVENLSSRSGLFASGVSTVQTPAVGPIVAVTFNN